MYMLIGPSVRLDDGTPAYRGDSKIQIEYIDASACMIAEVDS